MCGAYVLATVLWQKKTAQGETSKRMYNAITTGVSIALGLNIASAFKDMALNMRWVILSNRKRNLVEVSSQPRSGIWELTLLDGSPPTRGFHAETHQARVCNSTTYGYFRVYILAVG
jgi:hypothetical protein